MSEVVYRDGHIAPQPMRLPEPDSLLLVARRTWWQRILFEPEELLEYVASTAERSRRRVWNIAVKHEAEFMHFGNGANRGNGARL